MADDKLHPEVEAAIKRGRLGGDKWPDEHIEFIEDFARRIALLAASKAREEQREVDAKVCEAEKVDADATSDSGDHAYNVAIDHCAAAIRRGKP